MNLYRLKVQPGIFATKNHKRFTFSQECKITDCGEFKTGDDWGINDNDEPGDILPPYPSDWDKTPEELEVSYFHQWLSNIT